MATEFERFMGHGSLDAHTSCYGTVSVIIPVRNAAPYINRMIGYVHKNWKEKWGALEVVITDDCSQDRTVAMATLDADYVVPHKRKCGIGKCVRDAMDKARGDFRLVIEPGRVNMIERAPLFLDWLRDGFDVAVGNRFVSENRKGFRGNLTAIIANRIADQSVAPGINDLRSGFKGFTRHSGKRLYDESCISGIGIDGEVIGLAQRMGMRIKEVALVEEDAPPMVETIQISTAMHLIIDSVKARSSWSKKRILKWEKVA